MKKKWIRYVRNGVMGLLIAAGIASGIFFVGRVRGWFPTQKEQTVALTLTAKELTGTALVERDGISYQLKESEPLRIGDQVTLRGKGTVLLCGTGSRVYCGEKSAFLVGVTDAGAPQLTLTRGELFSRSEGKEQLRLVVGNQSALLKKGTVDLKVTENLLTLDVLSGSVSFTGGKQGNVTGTAGKRLLAYCTKEQWGEPKLESLTLTHLSDFGLTCAGTYTDLCVTKQQIQEEVVRREKVAQAALEAKLNKKEQADSSEKEADTKETVSGEEKKQSEEEATENKEKKKATKETTDKEVQKKTTAKEKKAAQKKTAKKKATEKEKISVKKTDNETPKESSDKKKDDTTTESSGSCTIRIECSTILKNMDDLKESKRSYVPSNGVILNQTTVSFSEGETVYDVLTRTCKKAGIPLEVSYSGGYGSYYVEGIGNLYEFDCGRQSGWIYTVNGRDPNYGCSSYHLKAGDHIEWSYTCKGLGSDVT